MTRQFFTSLNNSYRFKSIEKNYRFRIQRAYQINVDNEIDENSKFHEQSWLNENNDHKSNYIDKNYFDQNVNFIIVVNEIFVEYICVNCTAFFRFRNQLFRHLRQRYWQIDVNNVFIVKQFVVIVTSITINFFENNSIIVIRFVVKSNIATKKIDYVFKNWHYATFKMKISAKNIDDIVFDKSKMNVCIDFDCFLIVKRRFFMKKQLNDDMKIQQLALSMSIREINDKLIKISDFVLVDLFIIDVDSVDKSTTVVITAKVHLVNNFNVNMLIEVNVLKSQKMTLNFNSNKFIINSCDVQTDIDSITRFKSNVKRTIRNQKTYIVLSNEIIKISIIFSDDLSSDRNFLFEFQCNQYLNQNDDVFVHIMNVNLFFVQVHNIIETFVILSRRARLKFVIEFNQQKCYQTTIDDVLKIVCDWMFKRTIQNNWKTKITKTAVVVVIVFAITIAEYIDSITIASANIELNIVFESFVVIDLFIDLFIDIF